jgi:hypothetical protein
MTLRPRGNGTEGAEHTELRRLLASAIGGLDPGEREVIELQLRQGLEAAEVASVLGVSRNRAHSLLSRARGQLEVCLGVLLVGRAGREDCAELARLLSGWDGRLTAALRRRVHRHIARCATCANRRAFELRPAAFGGLPPLAGMAAAAAESFRLADSAPAGLKGHVLHLATGQDPSAVAHRAAVLGHAGSFGRHGFPRPVHGTVHGRQVAVAGMVVLAVLIAAIAFALTS